MPTICVGLPIPSFPEILSKVTFPTFTLPEFPDFKLELPSIGDLTLSKLWALIKQVFQITLPSLDGLPLWPGHPPIPHIPLSELMALLKLAAEVAAIPIALAVGAAGLTLAALYAAIKAVLDIDLPALPSLPDLPDFSNLTMSGILGKLNLAFSLKLPRLPGIPPIPAFKLPSLPAMPSLPNPMFPGIEHPFLDIVMLIQELQTNAMMGILKIIFGKFASILSFPLPAMPILGLSFLDLFSMDAAGLIQRIRDALALGIDFAGIIPIPFTPHLHIPSIAAVQIAKLLLKNLIGLVMDVIIGKISAIADLLIIPIPAFPTFVIPSMADLYQIVLNAFEFQIPTIPDIPDWPGLPGFPDIPPLPSFSFDIPGFPSFNIPSPLIPKYKNPALEIVETLSILLGELQNFVINKLAKFVSDFLGILGFSFPELCYTF